MTGGHNPDVRSVVIRAAALRDRSDRRETAPESRTSKLDDDRLGCAG